MATTKFSDLSSLLLANYGSTIVSALTQKGPGNQMYPQNSIMGRLRDRGRILIGSGESQSDRLAAEWGVHYATATATSFGVGDSYPAATKESVNTASLEWKRVGMPLEIDNLAFIARNGARGSIGSIVAFEFESKLKALISAIETQLASDGTGNSGKDITGFRAFLSMSNTYATIDQATAAYWRAKVTDAASATLAKAHLQAATKELFDAGSIGPASEIWMGSTQWQKFAALYSTGLRAAPGGNLGGEGIAPRYADGIVDLPVIAIPSMPADEIWIVNLDRITLHFLDHSQKSPAPGTKPDGTATHEGVPIGIETIEKAQDVKALMLKAYVQLVCKNPRDNAAIINLAT